MGHYLQNSGTLLILLTVAISRVTTRYRHNIYWLPYISCCFQLLQHFSLQIIIIYITCKRTQESERFIYLPKIKQLIQVRNRDWILESIWLTLQPQAPNHNYYTWFYFVQICKPPHDDFHICNFGEKVSTH